MAQIIPQPTINMDVRLDDKWELVAGRVVMNGTQAIARLLIEQSKLDRSAGLNTAGYVTGYRGSPLGNVDTVLWGISDRLKEAEIVFQPGVNEDIAATAVRGTQQIDALPDAKYDGVFAAWYGKGPGVDRSGDAFKHGNCAGTHRNGGVLLFYGDDHAGKSSTVSHQSEQAVAANLIPSLYPANVEEIIRFGLLGFALSRYSGLWVGIKCVNDAVEQTATVDIDFNAFTAVRPPYPSGSDAGIHIGNGAFNPLGEEQTVIEKRLPLVHEFIRANQIDKVSFSADEPQLAIVTSGKTYGDVRTALNILGLSEQQAARSGISLYKVGCIWPLEPEGLKAFANGSRTLLVVEEKKSFLEQQICSILVNQSDRPAVIGKKDEEGAPLFSSVLPIEAVAIARVIAERMQRLGHPLNTIPDKFESTKTSLAAENAQLAKRAPYFCSGCPHNRSTRIPDGSISMTGIGCHTMVNFVRPDIALLPTQMGGEGGNWLGLAPFSGTKHIFQNMGDGTYYHSGLLAIRAAVAAKVNITYKILYNDAVAMTGGQPVDGPISVAEIARQVRDEGVGKIFILSDDPSRHRNSEFPSSVMIRHRDELDSVQRELRDTPGCTVLIYEQTCAAEKRRRRKRGTFPNPPKRLFIAKEVCEGCGDCSEQSTCVSLIPQETAMGRKRAIDQSSCNKDYSCLNGFCPSFITVTDAEPRKPQAIAVDDSVIAGLPDPKVRDLDTPFNMMIAGIGGTGVVTVGALIGMAAHLEGHAMSLFDLTGLSQKNGAVFSHVRIASTPHEIAAQKIGDGESDLVLAFDMVAALAPESAMTIAQGRTKIIANADVTPTVSFQFDRDFATDPAFMFARLKRSAGSESVTTLKATELAEALMGDSIGTNLFLVGVAAQSGALPIGIAAIEQAIRLNGVAVTFNLKAFSLGRLYAQNPEQVERMVPKTASTALEDIGLDDLIAHRVDHLTNYQSAELADKYRHVVERVRFAEMRIDPDSERLTRVVVHLYAKLLAYKDEYEVARLLTNPELERSLKTTFEDGGRISFNLAPPMLGGKGYLGRPRKREFGPWILPLMRVLVRLRRLRGTRFDLFGYTAERKAERAAITHYEGLVETVLARLNANNLPAAVALLNLADRIRGYGPVKEAALAEYYPAVEVALGKLADPPSPEIGQDNAVSSPSPKALVN